MNKTEFLAIIPARGGSKRLPHKNLLPLAGKALIGYSVEAALKCKAVSRVLVTSDDDEILSLAKSFGADIIKRPKELASDTASTFDAIKHAVEGVEEAYENIILLQPTSPLRKAIHIDEAVALFNKKNADAVVSVCKMDHSPLWSNTLDESLSMEGFISDEVSSKRSQDLEPYYRLNGAIYIAKRERLLAEKTFFLKKNIFAYKMPRESSVDIDEAIDFKIAEVLLSNS